MKSYKILVKSDEILPDPYIIGLGTPAEDGAWVRRGEAPSAAVPGGAPRHRGRRGALRARVLLPRRLRRLRFWVVCMAAVS